MNRSFYARRGWPIMIVLAVLSPLVFWGSIQAFRHSNNNIHQWLPQHFEETDTYEDFRRVFGTDDFALVSWDGCTLDDERLAKFADRVVPQADQRRPGDGSEWFLKVMTGPQVLEILTDEPFDLSRKEALRRLEGTLVGPDHQTTCALVTLSEAGDAKRTAALKALKEIATTHCGVPPEELRLGGDAVINAAIDIESERAIQQWIVLSWVIALGIAWWCLRSVKLMVMIFVVAVYSSNLATATIHYSGGTMNLVLVVVPVLIYVLALSASVHLTNYYREAIRESGPAGAPVRAVRVGWEPCALSAITTALGLISLCVSNILPVKLFGIYSALGIVLSLGILFLLLPAAMEKWPLARASNPSGRSAGSLDGVLRRLAEWIIRRRRPVVGVCLVSLAFFAGGVALIQTTVAPSRFFDQGSKWVQDSNWLQERLGPLIPLEVIVRFDNRCPMSFLEQLELVRRVERALHSFEEIGGTISAATFCPASSTYGTPLIGRPTANVILNRSRNRLAATGYFHSNAGEELWRISARVRAFSDVDHDRFLRDVKERVNAFLEKRVDRLLEDRGDALLQPGASPSEEIITADYTGVVPLVYLAQRELLSGLRKSFLLAFVMIAVVMFVLLRNPLAALLVMLPNVFPAVITFGTMGWTGTLIDVGAMMTASVALGIAVDDTLHFLTWFRRSLDRGLSRREAIVEAYRRCAPAMTQTTLIAGLGILVFWLSSFQPVSQFGLLMFILLAAALVGDLVLLPAMLATRLGKLFERHRPPCAP